MTKQIEQDFYEAFDIEPIYDNIENKKRYRAYPPITDRILLELIVLANQIMDFDKDIISVKELKNIILEDLIKHKDNNIVRMTVREIMGVE